MTLKCYNCGKPIANGQAGACPYCGSTEIGTAIDAYQNYSGSVSVSSSNASAFQAINYATDMLKSIAASDNNRAKFVVPAIEKLKEAADAVKKQEAAFVASRKPDWVEYGKKLEEYKAKVDKCAEEPVFQDFFEKNAHFLEPRFKTAYPKYRLADELIPDFLLVLHDSSYLFVEIEKPGTRLFDKSGKPTAPFSHALQQIRDQLKWVADNQEFLRRRECPNLTMDKFRGLLVVGRSIDLSQDELERLENINSEVRGKYEVKTFDGILSENEVILANIKKYFK